MELAPIYSWRLAAVVCWLARFFSYTPLRFFAFFVLSVGLFACDHSEGARAQTVFSSLTDMSDDCRVSVAIDGESELHVLRQIAQQCGFKLEFRERRVRRVSVHLQQQRAIDAISQILFGRDYRLEYQSTAADKPARLSALVVGGGDNSQMVKGDPAVIARPSHENTEISGSSPMFTSAMLASTARKLLLDHPIARERGEFIEGLSVEKDAVTLSAALARDPVAEVRLGAVNALSRASDERSKQQIIDALDDDSPIVVNAAIEFLEANGSEKDIGYLVPLLENENPIVRQNARNAMQFLQ